MNEWDDMMSWYNYWDLFQTRSVAAKGIFIGILSRLTAWQAR